MHAITVVSYRILKSIPSCATISGKVRWKRNPRHYNFSEGLLDTSSAVSMNVGYRGNPPGTPRHPPIRIVHTPGSYVREFIE
jgi:hypothetical protein